MAGLLSRLLRWRRRAQAPAVPELPAAAAPPVAEHGPEAEAPATAESPSDREADSGEISAARLDDALRRLREAIPARDDAPRQ